MILTEKAITHLRNQNIFLLRIGVQGGGCSGFQYLMEEPGPEDQSPLPADKVLKFDSVTIYVDPVSWMYLNGTELDYYSTLEQSGFIFNNPNVKTTCGCGKSFGT